MNLWGNYFLGLGEIVGKKLWEMGRKKLKDGVRIQKKQKEEKGSNPCNELFTSL